MGLRLKNQDSGSCFFVTTSFLHRKCLGNIPGVYAVLAESRDFGVDKIELKLLAYVLMPSHIHLVVLLDGMSLASLMRDFKKYAAQKALVNLCGAKKVWQAGYDRQAIWSYGVLRTKIEYIHANPVRAGLASTPEEWYYSSAADYCGRVNEPVRVWKEWN